jgi:prevent-host-death family protein
MREIEVQELKATLEDVMRSVEAGERVRVTESGRPVADFTPIVAPHHGPRMRRLVAEGKVTPASRSLPLPSATPRNTGKSASSIVLAERNEEC